MALRFRDTENSRVNLRKILGTYETPRPNRVTDLIDNDKRERSYGTFAEQVISDREPEQKRSYKPGSTTTRVSAYLERRLGYEERQKALEKEGFTFSQTDNYFPEEVKQEATKRIAAKREYEKQLAEQKKLESEVQAEVTKLKREEERYSAKTELEKIGITQKGLNEWKAPDLTEVGKGNLDRFSTPYKKPQAEVPDDSWLVRDKEKLLYDKALGNVVENRYKAEREKLGPPNKWTGIWATVASTVVNYVRQNVTAGVYTPEQQAERRTQQEADLRNNPLVKGLVKVSSNNAKRQGTNNVLKLAKAVGALDATQKASNNANEYMLGAGYKLQQIEQGLQEKARIDEQPWYISLPAQAVASMPASMATRYLPIAGWFMMGNSVFRNTLEQTNQRIANGENITDTAAFISAAGNASFEVITEMIFPAFGRFAGSSVGKSLTNATKGLAEIITKKSAKTLVSEAGELTLKTWAKNLGKQVSEEGLEEVLNDFLSAGLATMTTDKGKTIFSDDLEGRITLAGLLETFAVGGLSGGMSGIGGIIANTPSIRKAATFNNVKVSELTNEQLDAYFESIATALQDPKNAEKIIEANVETLEKYESEDVKAQDYQKVERTMPTEEQQAPVQAPSDPVQAPATAEPIQSFVPQTPASEAVRQRSATQREPVDIINGRRARAEQAKPVAPVVSAENVQETVANAPRAEKPISTKKSPNNYQDLIPTLLSAKDLIVSNDVTGNETPGYNKAYQPRNRDRKASVKQMQNIVSDPDVRELVRTGDVSSGISSFNPADLNVLSGNGRTAAIQEIYRAGGEKAEQLRTAMLDLAQSLGIDITNAPADPVVSGALPEGVDPVKFAQDSNPKQGLEYSPAENAKGDATRLTPKMLLILKDQDLNDTANVPFVRDFLSSFSNEEAAVFQQENGSLSQQGIKRIENAIIYAAFPSDTLMNLISESTDSHVKNITNALKNVSALVVKTKEAIRKGIAHDLDISEDIVGAVEQYIQISKMPKVAGYESAIDAYFAQVGMAEVELSIMEEKLISIFYGYRKNRKAIEGFFTDYYEGIEKLGNPKEMSLFGEPLTVEKQAYIDRAFIKELGEKGKIYERENGTEESPNQISLDFDMGATTSDRQAGTQGATTEAQPRVENKAEPERVRTQAQEATKPAKLTYKMADLEKMYQAKQIGAELTSAVDEWLKTDEAADIRKIKNREDLAAEVYSLKSQINYEDMTADKVMKIDLQLLAMDRWASRLDAVPEGSAVTEHMRKMMEVLRRGQPQSVKNELSAEVTDEMIFHDILADKAVQEKAEARMQYGDAQEKDRIRRELLTSLTALEDDLDPSIVIQADLYVKELFDQGDNLNAVAMSDIIAKRLTTVARFLRAAGISADYFGTKKAKKLIDSYNEDMDPVASDTLDDVTKETVSIVIGGRRQAADTATKELDRSGGTDTSEMTSDQIEEEKRIKSLINSLARKILDYAKSADVVPKEPTLDQLMIKRLLRKFTEKNPHMKERVKTDPYAVLFQIVSNRGEYAEIWEGAQEELTKATAKAENANKDVPSDVYTFIDQALSPTHPVSAEAFIKSALSQAIKESGKSLNDYAKDYFFKGETSLQGFYDYVVSQVEGLDERSVTYLERMIKPVFKRRLEERRNEIRTNLANQVKRRSKVKLPDKTSTELMLNKMMDVTFRDELSIPELRERWAERLNLPNLSAEMIADIYDSMKRIANMKSEEDQMDAYFELNTRLAQTVPATFADKYLAWARFSMLMQPPTLFRNMISNISTMPLYKLSDRVQSGIERMMGIAKDERTYGPKFVSKIDDKTFLGKTVLAHTARNQLERFITLSSKYDIRTISGLEKRYFKSQFLNNIVRSPYKVMNEGQLGKIRISVLGDMYTYQIYFQREMANYLNAKGFSETMPEAQKNDLIKKAMAQSADVAAVRTFRQKTGLSDTILKMSKPTYSNAQMRKATPVERQRMKKRNAAKMLIAKTLIPFVLTPTALVYETVKFSPYAGLYAIAQLAGAKVKSIKTKVPIPTETKRNIAKSLSQSVVGSTVPFAVGFILGLLGYVDTEPPENEKEKIQWELEGRRKYSIFIPGKGALSIDWLQPIGTTLLMGASASKAFKGDEVLGAKMATASVDSMQTLIKAGFVGNVMNLFGGAKYGETEAEQLISLGSNGIFMMLPSMLARFNRVVDPYVRDIYSGTDAEDLKSRFLSYVPVASFTNPLKIDVWGNEVKSSEYDGIGGIADRTFLNMLSPFLTNNAYQDSVTKHVLEVYNKSGTRDALPNFQSKSFDGYTVTGKEYEWLVKDSGQRMYKSVQTLMKSAEYRTAKPEEQAKKLASAYTKARKEAREAYLKKFNPKK